MKYEVWVAGPDDLYHYLDKADALQAANQINITYLSLLKAHPDTPLCVAIVREIKDEQDYVPDSTIQLKDLVLIATVWTVACLLLLWAL